MASATGVRQPSGTSRLSSYFKKPVHNLKCMGFLYKFEEYEKIISFFIIFISYCFF